MKFITKEGLKELDNYKYVSGGYSWLDNKINPFWEWAVTLLPTVICCLIVVDGTKPRNFHWVGPRDSILCRHALLRLHFFQNPTVLDILLGITVHLPIFYPRCHRWQAGKKDQEWISPRAAVRSWLRFLLNEFFRSWSLPSNQTGEG